MRTELRHGMVSGDNHCESNFMKYKEEELSYLKQRYGIISKSYNLFDKTSRIVVELKHKICKHCHWER